MLFRVSNLIAAGVILTGCISMSHHQNPPQDSAQTVHTGEHLVASTHSFDTTVQRLQSAIDARGLTTFAVIDHSKGAAGVGIDLSPLTLFIFGSPKAGAPLMQRNARMGLDLPMKMLVHEQDGAVHIVYPDITSIAASRGLDAAQMPVPKMAQTLSDIAAEATR